jgi:hypothetical protein
MRLAAPLTLALAACGAEPATPLDGPTADDAAAMGVQPEGCAETVTLIGAITTAPRSIGPRAVDANGLNVCLALDAAALARAHFTCSTAYEPGAASSFAVTLQRPDRSTIHDGWDVTVGAAPARSMAHLEWSPPAGAVTHAVLWLRARGPTATTTVELALFDPLE